MLCSMERVLGFRRSHRTLFEIEDQCTQKRMTCREEMGSQLTEEGISRQQAPRTWEISQ